MERLFVKTFSHHKHQDLVVIFEALPENLSIDGQFSEESDVQWVKDQLRQGNEAAWFCAKVTVSLRGHGVEAYEYLGACSYKSFNDFTDEKDGYFVDMVNGLTEQLIPQLKDAMGKIESVLTALEQN